MLSDEEKRKNKAQSKYQDKIDKLKARQASRYMSTLDNAIRRVKEVAKPESWCSNHSNCFRASFGVDNKAESDAHRNKKYQLWCEYRKLGCTVFTELRLTNGRPDLIVCYNNGNIEIIEIIESESESSILAKENKYPFIMKVVKA